MSGAAPATTQGVSAAPSRGLTRLTERDGDGLPLAFLLGVSAQVTAVKKLADVFADDLAAVTLVKRHAFFFRSLEKSLNFAR